MERGTRTIRRARLWATIMSALTMAVMFVVVAPPAHAALNVTITDAPYNAVGNGTTNNRVAIQSAIDDVYASGGGVVTVPSGTFKTGNIVVRAGVTLNLSTPTSVLLQSQTSADYSYTPVLGHNTTTGIKWDHSMYANQPLVFAANAANVTITGSGRIDMTDASSDATTIHVNPIGFYQVTDFEISDITIRYSNAYFIALFTTARGLVTGVTLSDPGDGNTDGISMMNSQNIRITGNTLSTGDDGIYVWSSYDDPRGGAGRWWSSAVPKPSTSIEIDDNVVTVSCCKAIALIPWGAGAPDPSQVEISAIDIHDNVLTAGQSVGCWCDDPYHGAVPFDNLEQSDHAPMKDIVFRGNTYNSPISFGAPVITDVSTDFGKMSPGQFLNAGFEVGTGPVYWSTEGTGSQVGSSSLSVGQVGARYGYIQNYHLGYTALYEGLGLSASRAYTFSARVQTSGAPARMFVYNTCTGTTIATLSVSNTSWATQSLSFTTTGSCSNYHLGIDRGSTTASGAWARIDSATLTSTTIDNGDAAVAYSGTTQTYANAADIGGSHTVLKSSGATAVVTFTGTRARVLGLTSDNFGYVDVYVDGVFAASVDTYSASTLFQRTIFDTGTLPSGSHIVTLVASWTKNPAATGYYTALDAVEITP